jgi:hypothetical protein
MKIFGNFSALLVTTCYFHGTLIHERKYVELVLPSEFLQSLDKFERVCRKHFHEIVQNGHAEGARDDLLVPLPFFN